MGENFAVKYQEIKAPLQVQLELTSACNHVCMHCYNFWREPGSSIGTLSSDNLGRVIDNLAEAEVLSVILTGGEPLLVPDLLLQAIDQAQAHGIHCGVNSNLSLLTPDMAAALAKRNVPLMTSILSHDPQTFDKIVNRSGAFQKVFTGLKLAQAHGMTLFTNMVVMRENLSHVYETGRFLQAEGIQNFAATRVHPSQSCRDFDLLKLTPQEVVSIADDLLRLRDAFGLHVDTLTASPKCLFPDMRKYGDLILGRRCSAGKTEAAIGADGGMRACAHSDETYGNALNESVRDIWVRMGAWRDGSLLPDDCKACDWVEPCGSGCRVDAKYFHGTRNARDPYMVGKDVNFLMPDPETPAEIRDDVDLFVNPAIRFRSEKMGVFLVVDRFRRLVTTDTADLLKSLMGASFQVRDLVEHYGLDPVFSRRFFAALAINGLVLAKEGRDSLRVRQRCLCNPTC